MGHTLKSVLVFLMAALAVAGCATSQSPGGDADTTSDKPAFVLRAARTLTVAEDASIEGGAIAAERVEVSGGRVDSIYAPTVHLESARVRGEVFADELVARESEYGRRSSFDRDVLGALASRPVVAPGDGELLVRSGKRAALKTSTGAVRVQQGGTLIVEGAFYELASLTLDDGASVIVREPSKMSIEGRLALGAGAYVGPPRDSDVKLNLQLLVAGEDTGDAAAVEIGPGATIAADLVAPAGTVMMRKQSTAQGRFEAQDISVSAAAHAAGMGLGAVKRCGMYKCWGEAVAGGTIDLTCGWVALTPDIVSWLNSHTGIRDAIKWQFQTSGGVYHPDSQAFVAYPNWTGAEKIELEQAFDRYWTAYCLNDPLQGDAGLPDPPVNLAENIDSDTNSAHTKISGSDMRALYLSNVGHSLVLELGDYVPWSILGDDAQSLEIYFSSLGLGRRMYYADVFSVGESGPLTYVEDWRTSYGKATPSPPAGTFDFLKSNGLVGNTRHQTIVNLLNWSRDNMIHYYGAYSFKRAEEIWQYRGHPPVSRVVSGTTDPQFGFEHWTAGCHGTAGWYRAVLRSANIPVQVPIACDHAQIHFRSEGLYLDHGDNPYTGYASALWPPEEALIDQTTYTDWFGSNLDNQTTGCSNVGRRPQELDDQYNP